jgi:ABC-type phosphate/phosphonate transport system substrate-binding protein
LNLLAATYLAPCNRPLYELVAAACDAELVDGGDWKELKRGAIDIAFVCSPPMIWLGDAVEAVAAPVLTDLRFGGRPLYCSEVVVHRDSRFQSLEDLRGARWAINEPSSWSGYWVTLNRVGSWDFFGEVVGAGFHEKALRMVADGEIDGAAIDCHVLAVVRRQDPTLVERLKVLEMLGPAPSQPVVVRTGLKSDVKARIRKRLLGLASPEMREFGVEGFAPAPDYSQIASVVGAAQATNDWR